MEDCLCIAEDEVLRVRGGATSTMTRSMEKGGNEKQSGRGCGIVEEERRTRKAGEKEKESEFQGAMG